MTDEVNEKYWICCLLCDNDKCMKGTDKCEAEKWEKEKKGPIEEIQTESKESER